MSFILFTNNGSPPLLTYPLCHKPVSHGNPHLYFPSCNKAHYRCNLSACRIESQPSCFATPIMAMPLSCQTCRRCIHPLQQTHAFASLAARSPRTLASIHNHHIPSFREKMLVSASLAAPNVEKKLLLDGLDPHLHLPQHVAIIMDGNSRWAQDKGVERREGHYQGLEALIKIIWLSSDYGISAFTAFIFSTENWRRSEGEVSSLMQLFENMFSKHLDGFMRYDVQVRVIGDLQQLPRSLQDIIVKVQNKTMQNKGLKLSFAINYGGRSDITQACKALARKIQHGTLNVEDISEESIENELSTNWLGLHKNPDLMIRTSGEHRISNYLLWQLAYSELVFLNTYWPAMNEDLYANTIRCFQDRDRRYGTRQSSKS